MADFLIYPVFKFVIRYRREVVEKNLALAFPEKGKKERLEIEKKFYHFLSDSLVEAFKMKRMSREELTRRFSWENFDEVMSSPTDDRLFTLCYSAHFANWEWLMGSLFSDTDVLCYYIYTPLNNKAFDQWVRLNRTQHGSNPVTKTSVSNLLTSLSEKKQKCVILAGSDQLPKERYVKHFHRFMGIKTKVLTGTESLINKYDMRVFYCYVKRVKRGYYVCRAELLDDSIKRDNGEWPFTDAYFDRLELQIREQPELWLWSHDRWRR